MTTDEINASVMKSHIQFKLKRAFDYLGKVKFIKKGLPFWSIFLKMYCSNLMKDINKDITEIAESYPKLEEADK